MLRNMIEERGVGYEKEFRWRGGNVSRIEGLSDAVFAFAVTLLVVSLQVPKSFDDLIYAMKGFVAFGICFTFLIWIWYNHYIFFRRYGLQNAVTVTFNAILLFVVLFYIYPLKFLFTFLVNAFFGLGSLSGVIERGQMGSLMIIYSIGFIAIFSIFCLLYYHAYKKRGELELDELEIFFTKAGLHGHFIHIGVGIFSILIVIIFGSDSSPFAGISYALIGPAHGIYWASMKKRYEAIKEKMGSKSGIEND